MKIQMTTLAAAISLAISGAALANTDVDQLNDNLDDVSGVTITDPTGVTINTQQIGDGNSAIVFQANGSTAESRVYQDSQDSVAGVYQEGDNQYSDVDQQITQSGVAGVAQFGSSQRSRIQQNGADNSYAGVLQAGSSNDAFISQANVGGSAESNVAGIAQDGTDNRSGIRQLSSNNIALSAQFGDLNESYIVQRSGSGSGQDAYS